jgi:hypothetical protein
LGLNYHVELVCNALLFSGALFGFVYSLVKFFKPKSAMYLKMVGCALGCLFIERLYEIVQYVVAGDLAEGFIVGDVGNIGCFLFLLSANIGALDSLMDDGSKELKKYRLIAVAAPAVTVAAAVAILFSPSHMTRNITCAVEELFIGASAYYSLKHFIIPKRYLDFLSGLRPFHLFSLILACGITMENIFWCYQLSIQAIWFIPYAILLAAMLALAPSLERGTKQWRT